MTTANENKNIMHSKFLVILIIFIFFYGCKDNEKTQNIHNYNVYNSIRINSDSLPNYLPENFDKEFFNRKNIYRFFELYKNCDYENIYNSLLDERLKEIITKDDLNKFFQIQKFNCSDFDRFISLQAKLNNNFIGDRLNERMAVIDFLIKYKHTEESPNMRLVYSLKRFNQGRILNITMGSVNNLLKFNIDNLSQPVIEGIKERNFEKIYQLYSEKFKKNNSLESYSEVIKPLIPEGKFINSDFIEQDLYINQEGIGMFLIYDLKYENQPGIKLILNYLLQNDNFVLNRINFNYTINKPQNKTETETDSIEWNICHCWKQF